ncbi:MAG: hypothetical protein CL610_09155 [Anaerolineaceae bacterium]|nr:hypothetical protein [Anaerolineaceae bacterium]
MRNRMTTASTRHLLVLTLIILCGFGVRAALHNYHGLEGDDGFSLSLARLDIDTLLRGLAALELDIHPPGHFLALKAWIAVAGESLLSLRLMNILADVATGALMMRVAGRILSNRAAVIAGLLWLASPLLIYSDNLIRMYTLLSLFAAAGTACVVEARYHRQRWVWYVGAAIAGFLAAFTHIVGALILVCLALGVAVGWLMDSTRRLYSLLIAIIAFVIAGFLYLPYGYAVWQVYQSGRPLGAEISEAKFDEPFTALFHVIAATLTHRLGAVGVGVAMTILLVAAAIWLWQRRPRQSTSLLVMVWAGLAGMAILGWVAGFYKARYLAPFAPMLLALMAVIIASLPGRYWRGIVTAGLVLILASGVVRDLDHRFRDDWVAAASFIRRHERQNDRIIVIPDWGQEAFRFHYQGNAPVVGLFPQVSPNIPYAEILEEQSANANGVWLVHYQPEVSDPDRLATSWFQSHASIVTEVFPAGMHIRYYDFVLSVDALPEDAIPLDARFGNMMQLHGYFLPVTQGSAVDSWLHPPSNWVQVVLYWEALTPNSNVTPRVRLTSPYAQVYGEVLDRSNDLLDRVPISTWQPGEIWEVAYDINLNPETPPGVYNIEVMVLDTDGQPLSTEGADAGEFWVIAGQFIIQ